MEIGEKQLKKILDEQRKEYQRYLKILSEDVNSKFKIIGEGITGMLEKQEDMQEKLDKNSVDIEIIKTDISFIKSGLKEKVDRDEFTALEKRVIFLENKYRRV